MSEAERDNFFNNYVVVYRVMALVKQPPGLVDYARARRRRETTVRARK